MKRAPAAAAALGTAAAIAAAALARPPAAAGAPAAERPEGCGAFAAPPPAVLRALAFGHDRALARVLWSRARVAHGTCLARGRRFEGAAAYVDAALALDPSFREPYRYVEAFVVGGPARPSPGDLRFVRRVLDGGAERFPADRELLARSGAFLAFVAPAHLEPSDAEAWRAEGLRRLTRAR